MNADCHTSLAGFPLGWRFTTTRLGRPAHEIISRITPLTADAAARVAIDALGRAPLHGTPLQSIRSDDSPDTVRARLRALPIDSATGIVLSWSDSVAATTDWDVFVAHWDDFCYPASDNVVVWGADGDWTLRYHHYEVFQFWRHPARERDRA